MKTRVHRVLWTWPSQKALATACVVGLLALGITAVGIINPKPILVVAGMSVAQGLGGLALLLYLVTVVAEYRRATGKGGPAPTGETKPEQT